MSRLPIKQPRLSCGMHGPPGSGRNCHRCYLTDASANRVSNELGRPTSGDANRPGLALHAPAALMVLVPDGVVVEVAGLGHQAGVRVIEVLCRVRGGSGT